MIAAPASALTNACALLSKESVGINSMRKLLAASCGHGVCSRPINAWKVPVPTLNPPTGALFQAAPHTPAPLEQHPRADRRDVLFRETLVERCERVFFGIVWAVQPQRFDRLVQIGRLWRRRLFGTEPALADLPKRPGAGEILGIADDLSVPTLVQAYQAGLFPHSHIGTPKWLSPTQRSVLFFQDLHISKRLKRLMRQGRYTVTFDQDFEG
jgi:leucyl/phenylalanyl-tRNA--protein transferase